MKIELCANCHEPIGYMEKACVFDGNVVCEACDVRLRGVQPQVVVTAPAKTGTGRPTCAACGGVMAPGRIPREGQGFYVAGGLLLGFFALALCLTVYGAIAGIPLGITALWLLCESGNQYVWMCQNCHAWIKRA